MSGEHLYNEQEIAAIFKQAALAQEAAHSHLAHSDGLTLAELQEIGQEAGITPEFIARAAAAADRTHPTRPPTTTLGIPVSVERIVDLPGPLSDQEWDRLVVDLRETFQAAGEVRRDGSLRQWRNGNLHVLVEPTASGHRLRFRTLNDSLKGGLMAGLLFFMMGLFFMLLVAAKGDFAVDLGKTLFVSMFSVLGLGSMGVSAYRLTRWREERKRQMEAIAARAAERLTAPTTPSLHEPASAPRLDLDAQTDRSDLAPERRPGRTRA